MFTIISYDIVDDKRRTKIMKLLKGYGIRVQYSVFECRLSPVEFAKLGQELRGLIDINTDSVRCYRLDVEAVERIAIYGIGKVTTEPTHWLV
jgi:CRISPR-associated protein Cas2